MSPPTHRPWEDPSPTTPAAPPPPHPIHTYHPTNTAFNSPFEFDLRPSLPLPLPDALYCGSISSSSSPSNIRKRRRISPDEPQAFSCGGTTPRNNHNNNYPTQQSHSPFGRTTTTLPPINPLPRQMHVQLRHAQNQTSPPPPPPPPTRHLPPSPPPPPLSLTTPPPALSALAASIHNLVLDFVTCLDASLPPPLTRADSKKLHSNLLSCNTSITHCLEGVYNLLLSRFNSLKACPLPVPATQSPTTTTTTTTTTTAAAAAVLSTLQHNLSTLQLSHATLSTEHAHLLSAMNRSKTRAVVLEKKLAVCTEENEALSNERERLLGVTEALEDNLEELRREKDEVRDGFREAGLQWSRILQGVVGIDQGWKEEVRELKTELRRKEEEVRKFTEVRREQRDGVLCGAEAGGGCTLKRDNEELRARVKELEECVQALKREGAGIIEAAERILKGGREALGRVGGVGVMGERRSEGVT